MNSSSRNRLSRLSRRRCAAGSGFSLVELLTVILVISVLMTVGVMGIRNLSSGKSTVAAIANAEGLFEEARSIAVGKGTTARVLILTDESKAEDTRFLRQVLVAYHPVQEDGSIDQASWELANRGYLLPDTVYYSREFSKKNHAGGGGELESENFVFPQKDYTGEYSYYEFNSEGVCTTAGASFIVGTGSRPPGGNPLVSGESRDFNGFVIWRNGRTSIFRNPGQMGLPPTIDEF